jgi:hypothetical protein
MIPYIATDLPVTMGDVTRTKTLKEIIRYFVVHQVPGREDVDILRSVGVLPHITNFHASEPNWLGIKLGLFTKLGKATITFIMSVRQSVYLSALKISAPTERIFIKCDILRFFEKMSRRCKFFLKCDKNNEYLIWTPVNIYDKSSPNSSKNEQYFGQNL